jgi:hypothetical protein
MVHVPFQKIDQLLVQGSAEIPLCFGCNTCGTITVQKAKLKKDKLVFPKLECMEARMHIAELQIRLHIQ